MMEKVIFIVEDEPDLLDLISEMLALEGYSVIGARSSEQAVELWNLNSEKIDLLLTDLTLPGNLSGIALAEKFRAEKPSLKIIFSSGHSFQIIKKEYILPGDANFLQKPFNPADLCQKIHSAFIFPT